MAHTGSNYNLCGPFSANSLPMIISKPFTLMLKMFKILQSIQWLHLFVLHRDDALDPTKGPKMAPGPHATPGFFEKPP